MKPRFSLLLALLALVFGLPLSESRIVAQSKKPAAAQQNDEEYGRLIKQHLQDPRIST